MIKDPAAAVAHVRRMVDEQAIYSTSGKRIPCQVDSICVHGDGPTAVTVSKAVRDGLEAAGIQDRAVAGAAQPEALTCAALAPGRFTRPLALIRLARPNCRANWPSLRLILRHRACRTPSRRYSPAHLRVGD